MRYAALVNVSLAKRKREREREREKRKREKNDPLNISTESNGTYLNGGQEICNVKFCVETKSSHGYVSLILFY